MLRAFVILILLTSTMTAAHAAGCATQLKPADGYKELSGMLKCLSDKLAAVEQELAKLKTTSGGASAAIAATIAPEGGDYSGGCLDVAPGEPKTLSLKIRASVKKELCWKDGRVFANALEIREDGVRFSFPGGGGDFCAFGQASCRFSYQKDARISYSAEKLVGGAGALIHLTFSP